MTNPPNCIALTLTLAIGFFTAQPGWAAETARYRAVIENTNTGQNFSPPVLILHSAGFSLFEPGEPASEALWRLAEDGAVKGFLDLRGTEPEIIDVVTGPSVHRRNAPIADIAFEAPADALLSLATMLTVTNDGFAALRAVPLPDRAGASVTLELAAFDAGSEANSESCDHVPCEVHGQRLTEGAEGVVAPHPGIRGDGDISERRGWDGQVLGTLTLTRTQ